ncbi:MAG TPA: T9SS type A sorting domain-containing protein [Prolixibacteraceae bacterium]|nr:T9SS type A sorting domain-containing protein [Prolixibacteraceae bacterium]
MNNKLKIIIILISVVSIAILFQLKFSNEDISYHKTKKFKTAEEFKAETIEKKHARRASGWSKPDKPSEFSKYQNRIRVKDGETKSGYQSNYRIKELEKARSKKLALKSANANLNWIERGPGNVSGRTRGLIIDPDDNSGNTWFTGSVGGGIWKTTNAGTSWTNLTPDLPNLATVCLAMAKSNTQIIYAGTGEGYNNADAIMGDGIFKTTNKGITWTQLASTAINDDFHYVNRIVVDPENPDILIAVTNTSIQKSIDGGTSWTTTYNDNRRIQHIVSNPGDFNILYATANNRGVLKSTDKGKTWKLMIEHVAGRIELAISPSNPNIIYALDENSNLFISNDAGVNWIPSSISAGSQDKLLGGQGWYNNTLAVDPDDPKKLTVGGINLYKVEVKNTSSTPTSIFKADTVNTSGFLDFTNFGGAFLGGGMEINTLKKNYTNIEIQFGPNKNQKAHRFKVPDGATSGVPASSYSYIDYVDVPFQVWDIEKNRQLMVSFRDQDQNGKFNLTTFSDELLIGREYFWINDVDYSTSPSTSITKKGGNEYEKIVYVWPVLAEGATWTPQNLPLSKITINRTELYAQYLTSTKLTDWAGQGSPYVHADLHNICYTKTNTGASRIVVANDGGVAFSDDLGITWKNPANGFNTTQFYGLDKHPTENRYIGGMQDNGSWFSTSDPNNLSNWVEATGGDGFDVVWNPINPEKLITSIYNNDLYKSNDGGISWGNTSSSIADIGTDKAPFITQIGYTPTDPDKLYLVGVSGVTFSETFGDNWQLSSISNDTWGWSGSGRIEPSLANPDIVWAASCMSDNGKVHVSLDGGKTFTATTNFETSLGSLSGLATHPTNQETAFALFSFAGDAKILRTTNLGKTWEDISGFSSSISNNGFPDVATYSLLVMPNNPSVIWVGTEIGLFVSNDNGASWEYANNGLPAVSIWEMKIRGNQVIVATHGRGIWSVELPQLANSLKAPTLINVGIGPLNNTNVQFINGSTYDSVSFVIDNSKEYSTQTNVEASAKFTLSLNIELENGPHKLQLYAYRDGIMVKSASKEFNYLQFNEAQESYENAFDIAIDDFIGEGFSIINYPALGDGMAIHTDHPYRDRNNISYLLKTPIIVKANDPTMLSYHDIPMIEEGEEGSIFGSSDFYDYVVVEGSVNGVDWIPLFDGYDFGAVNVKLGKTVDDTPSAKMFINHQVSLLDKFKENDIVLIRFRLFSDPASNGWGWVIDDIKIEHSIGTITDTQLDATTKIYPVPCIDQLNIELHDQFSKQAEINIYDLNGRKIQHLSITNQYKLQINTTTLKPAMYILEIKAGNHYEQKKFQVVK